VLESKWTSCACTIHTCYDAWPKLARLTSFWRPYYTYHIGAIAKDWISASTTRFLCRREMMAQGGKTDLEPGEDRLCKQCVRVWEKDRRSHND
jgi:hypothetical protein